MENWLYELVANGSEFVLLVQTYRNPFLDSFFSAATFLGNIEFYIIFVLLFYWVFNKQFGRQLTYLLAITSYLNLLFKNLFALPRPYEVDPNIESVVEQAGYGLPSGHTMISTAMWGYIAWYWRQKYVWLMPVAVLIVAVIAFSRIYLGVHFPTDVLVGLILGLIILTLWIKYEPALSGWVQKKDDRLFPILGIVGPFILLFLIPGDYAGYPSENAATLTGLWAGANIGFFYENRTVRFAVAGSWGQKLGRYLLGLIIVALFWFGLRVLFGMVDAGHIVAIILRFIRYSVTICAVAWWAPAIFVRLGLAGREQG